ncbi:THAP domain-containing protein 4-like [Leptonychotes weddellii]|uniref:THAP domain-containing protein 4-like n=1 Tax=Leptonychotes weddellii TaxID=9713 RepID=A0A7F8QBB5_LEPWE|nr:THAP domain-containing protein 4-like [Leptonychotes weddellii]
MCPQSPARSGGHLIPGASPLLLPTRFNAFHPDTRKPMHRECGFIRLKPDTNKVAFVSAQNTGIVEVEEGEVNGQELSITSHSIARISFAKEPHVEQVSLPLQPSLLPPCTCSPQWGHRSPLGLSARSCGRSPHMLRWGCATAESGPWQVGT